MKARVDPNICTGCGPCVEACPAVFEMGDDGIARVKLTPVPKDQEAACREAAANCPPEAIKIEE